MLSSYFLRTKWKATILDGILAVALFLIIHLVYVNQRMKWKIERQVNFQNSQKKFEFVHPVKCHQNVIYDYKPTPKRKRLPKIQESIDAASLLTDYFKKFDVALVLVEPKLIAQFISFSEDQNVNAIIERYAANNYITFMSSDNFKNTTGKVDASQKPAIDCYSVEQGSVVRHIFCLTKGILAHIIFMERRNDFFWFQRVHSIPKHVDRYISVGELMLGQYDGAFDQFTHLNKENILIPNEAAYFLQQIQASRFLECNETLNKFVKAKYSFADADENTNDIFKKALIALKRTMKKQNALFWAADGTLLGWYRQCAIINQTGDLDFAMWAKDYKPELLANFDKTGLGALSDTLGNMYSGFEMRTSLADLFLAYEAMDHVSSVTFSFDPATMYRLIYPKFELCSAELLQTKILVPCTAEEILSTEYGSEWMKPTTDYGYYNLRVEAVYDAKFWKTEMYKRYEGGRYAGENETI